MRSKRALVILAVSALAFGAALAPASAAKSSDKAEAKVTKIKGSIKVEGNPPLAELQKKVKIAQADAEKAAIKAVGSKESAKATYSELEIEEGFLVYSIDVKVPGIEGVEEVWIDAGNGKVLRRTHESDDDEDDEDDEGKKPD